MFGEGGTGPAYWLSPCLRRPAPDRSDPKDVTSGRMFTRLGEGLILSLTFPEAIPARPEDAPCLRAMDRPLRLLRLFATNLPSDRS
jgi:hypothetical protein